MVTREPPNKYSPYEKLREFLDGAKVVIPNDYLDFYNEMKEYKVSYTVSSYANDMLDALTCSLEYAEALTPEYMRYHRYHLGLPIWYRRWFYKHFKWML